jgi:hypothetical protein
LAIIELNAYISDLALSGRYVTDGVGPWDDNNRVERLRRAVPRGT